MSVRLAQPGALFSLIRRPVQTPLPARCSGLTAPSPAWPQRNLAHPPKRRETHHTGACAHDPSHTLSHLAQGASCAASGPVACASVGRCETNAHAWSLDHLLQAFAMPPGSSDGLLAWIRAYPRYLARQSLCGASGPLRDLLGPLRPPALLPALQRPRLSL